MISDIPKGRVTVGCELIGDGVMVVVVMVVAMVVAMVMNQSIPPVVGLELDGGAGDGAVDGGGGEFVDGGGGPAGGPAVEVMFYVGGICV